jgi:hypothetical protein
MHHRIRVRTGANADFGLQTCVVQTYPIDFHGVDLVFL